MHTLIFEVVSQHASPMLTAVGFMLLFIAASAVAANRIRRHREYETEKQVSRRTAEIEQQRAVLERQAQRLSELDELKSQFFANISHEIRTPLTLIIGPLREIVHGGEGEGDALVVPRDQLTLMLRNGQRLERLIGQVLDLATIESGTLSLNLEQRDLSRFVEHQVALFRGVAAYQSLNLSVRTPGEGCSALFDVGHMEKVIANLLSNAIKFTPKNGRIEVAVRSIDDYVEIRVSDDGIGIPEDEQAFVFDRFYRARATSQCYGGSGVGLSLAREIVELHGGSISVTSVAGEGSVFSVRIPKADENRSGDSVPGSDVELRPFATERSDGSLSEMPPDYALRLPSRSWEAEKEPDDRTTILLVDDNDDMRLYMRRILRNEYRILEARNGNEALALVRDELPDIMVADVMMPGLDGYALLKAVKSDPLTESIPVLLVTARAATADELRGLECGADDYIAKPFAADVLRARVRNQVALLQRLRKRYTMEVDLPSRQEEEPRSAFVRSVRAVVEAHMSEPDFSVERLADEVALSRSQLTRRLKEDTGVTAVVFIRDMRVKRAAEMLLADEGTVSEIAYAVGFNSLNYFSRCFRQHFDTSPSEFVERSGKVLL